MAFCNKCGAKVDDGVNNCPNCGEPVKVEAAPVSSNTGTDVNNFIGKVMALNNTADTTDQYDKKDIEDNMLMGILAYFSILVLIPIFAAPNSKFARFHANQGLILLIAEVAVCIVRTVLRFWIIDIICKILMFAILVFAVIGIYNVVKGKVKELPLVGNIKILK